MKEKDLRHLLHVETEACIGCGQCVRDCPLGNIRLNAEKKAEIKAQDCIKCGHCVAICPKNAVQMTGFSEAPRTRRPEVAPITPESLEEALVFRRTIRQFKEEPVSPEVVQGILEAGRWSPTGKNAEDVRYLLLEQQKEKIEALALERFRKLHGVAKRFNPALEAIEIDGHFLFKKAPLVLVVVAKDTVNGALAASNMALMAESYGLGVLYSGYFSFLANHSRTLQAHLGLKRKEKVVATLVCGYPAVHYPRSVQKEPVKLTRL